MPNDVRSAHTPADGADIAVPEHQDMGQFVVDIAGEADTLYRNTLALTRAVDLVPVTELTRNRRLRMRNMRRELRNLNASMEQLTKELQHDR